MRALILAAGKGTRMRSEKAKVLHEVLGRPMIDYVLHILEVSKISQSAIVLGAHLDQVKSYLQQRSSRLQPRIVLQTDQKGTGHAVMMAKNFLKASSDDVLILPGDMPLLRASTIQNFIRAHIQSKADASVLSARVANPKGYGRILRLNHAFSAIREELDASEAERSIDEISTGIYVFKVSALLAALKAIQPVNNKGEYYLTDAIEILNQQGKHLEAFCMAEASEAEGINSRAQLAQACQILNQRYIEQHMENGVTIVAPDQTWIESGVTIGQDSVIYPWTYIESGVKIGKRAQIGPCAKIRCGSVIGDEAIVGNFVEVNRSMLGKKVYAKHLAYLGDAEVGEGSNIGAGTVTANFDGKNKHKTKIGKNVLVGSNTVLVAPVHLEDTSRTGAGSVVTRGTRVPKKSTAVGVPARIIR